MLTSRFPGEVSGADLPTLTNPAGAGDMAAGKQAIGQDGGVVTGSLEAPGALAVLADTVSAGTVQGQPSITVSGPLGNDCILRNGASVDVSAQASAFGNAEAMDVAAGKTFTSAAGLEATGTMPIIEGKIITLNCGQTHTIPAGCHSGSGKVKAASLASQTAGTAAAKDIASGKTAWVNGVKVTGSAKKFSAVRTLSGSSLTLDATGCTHVRIVDSQGNENILYIRNLKTSASTPTKLACIKSSGTTSQTISLYYIAPNVKTDYGIEYDGVAAIEVGVFA